MLRIVDDGDALSAGVTVAGKYTLERVVGEGGMGVVWAARHVLTHKVCALKFLKERRAKDPKSYERLLREARAACAVRHPNVAQVHDLLELPSGAPFIVMDLLEGEPLSRRLEREHKLPLRQTLELLAHTMDAVLAAHAHGIVHRDLKPDNVFLERNGDRELGIKVLDFGIAKLAESVTDDAPTVAVPSDMTRSVTSTYSVLGTPKYMSPEQASPPGRVGFPSDVWALGMIAFECATGTLPPPIGEPNREAAITRALADAGFAAESAATVTAMLAEDPAARPALKDARERIGRAIEQSAPRTTRVLRREVVAAAVIAVGVVAIGAWVWAPPRNPPTEPARALSAVETASAPTAASASATASASVPASASATARASATASTPVAAPAIVAAAVATSASARPTPKPTARASASAAPSSAPSASGDEIPTHVRD